MPKARVTVDIELLLQGGRGRSTAKKTGSWESDEVSTLVKRKNQGWTHRKIADHLDRTEGSISSKLRSGTVAYCDECEMYFTSDAGLQRHIGKQHKTIARKATAPAKTKKEIKRKTWMKNARLLLTSDDEDDVATSSDASSSEEEEEEDHVVEKIIKHRDTKKAGREYYVKWLGWPSDQNTWEPRAHITNCVLLNVYERNLQQKQTSKRASKKKAKAAPPARSVNQVQNTSSVNQVQNTSSNSTESSNNNNTTTTVVHNHYYVGPPPTKKQKR